MGESSTIYAPATGAGVAAIAVIRLSGPGAGATIDALTGGRRPAPRHASLRRLRDPAGGEVLDSALLLWLPGPGSETGEDMAELHLHGGRAVLAGVLDVLARLPGLRLAEPGEFARRAFENGRLDLTAAEAVADLVAAETAGQRRQALAQLDGALAGLYDGWRDRLVRLLAHLEADIDFPDEDLPPEAGDAARAAIAGLAADIAAHLADGHRGERLRDGVRIAVIGAPNVGKSSLLNRLARREAAIVAPTAGTTRDVIEVALDLGGVKVILADTAGLRDAADPVEVEGVRRAQAAAVAADLRLAVFDATAWPALDPQTMALIDATTVPVLNKADLLAPAAAMIGGQTASAVSALTGAGVAALEARLTEAVADRFGARESPALTRARHRAALEEAKVALRRAAAGGVPPELVAEDVRLAARSLGRITGRVDVEELLDVIFRDFCIGK
ncbi:MAG: tRNA uridine-5-carboxymethylaminomethyl(34) synthesis GTPase MnmE [Alphaproteobacteria bacterium]|nr:tRNA uridine-5-carboxymethylaminomethyl(34) synthesis GTPase MnmE [Alphaproteobacteria bacterium]